MAVVGGLTALLVLIMSAAPVAFYGRTPLVPLAEVEYANALDSAFLYYSPNDHTGLNEMMAAFQGQFKDTYTVSRILHFSTSRDI